MEFAENRLSKSDGASFDDAGQCATDGVAFSFHLIYKVCHFFCFFRVRTTYIVCFYQIEVVIRVSALQFDRTYLRSIGSDIDTQLTKC